MRAEALLLKLQAGHAASCWREVTVPGGDRNSLTERVDEVVDKDTYSRGVERLI